jgi:hypothetical protein
MSGAAAFALLLFGCADDGTACERLAWPTETYASTANCQARVEDALTSDIANRADAPTVVAKCLDVAKAAHLGSGPFDLNSATLRPALASR